MATCRTCRAFIVFRPNEYGTMTPLDPLPDENGDVVMRGQEGVDRIAHVLRDGEEPLDGEDRYALHSKTCEGSDIRRRKRS